MDNLCWESWVQRDEWEDLWPLSYPAWSDSYEFFEDSVIRLKRQPLYERAQERANRRWEKKSMKAARAQGLEKRDRMPGAWPA